MIFAERTTQRESTGALQGVKHGVETGKQRGSKKEEDLIKEFISCGMKKGLQVLKGSRV